MNIWESLGFTENPYSARPIPPTAEGERLLVGRDAELSRLITNIRSSDTHSTIEGPNGVGKTSLVAVACYKLSEQFRHRDIPQLFIPVAAPFQLGAESDPQDFKRRVLFSVAQAMLAHHDLISRLSTSIPALEDIHQWLNSPLIQGGGAGFSVAGFGANGSISTAANSTPGFVESGFEETIKGWLRAAFPSNRIGAVVCVLDNLELLQTSAKARQMLEALRDDVLGLQGLKWVLCGARGIVRSVASSPRLQGVLADPILLNPIADSFVPEVIARRVEQYKAGRESYSPVEQNGFKHLYDVGNKNLRNALKYCEDFAFWLAPQLNRPESQSEKLVLIETWFAEMADQYVKDTTGVKPRAWTVFDRIMEFGGSISPSDYADFDFESAQAMRPHLKSLEDAQLIDSEIDETDNRRKTITVTPRGWIVRYQRSGFILQAAN